MSHSFGPLLDKQQPKYKLERLKINNITSFNPNSRLKRNKNCIMRYLSVISLCHITRLKLVSSYIPICTQVRWKKPFKRKPRWLPMAPSKVFRISEHPYVPPDEKQLVEDLLEEYLRKVESLRKLFQDELSQNPDNEASILEMQQKEEEEFRILLEDNKNENERIRAIREKTLEDEFQQQQLELLQMVEEQKKEIQKTKLKVDEIVRKEKEKAAAYITKENIDAAVEQAIDNPVNISFSISLDGSINWEEKPAPEYEADIKRRVFEGMQN